jgi:hypothetical protein
MWIIGLVVIAIVFFVLVTLWWDQKDNEHNN